MHVFNINVCVCVLRATQCTEYMFVRDNTFIYQCIYIWFFYFLRSKI